LNIQGLNGIRQTELQTAEPLEPEPNVFEAELAIAELNSHKSPGNNQIAAELRQGVKKISYENNKIMVSI
jgi:hypothetical protein